MTKSLTVQDRVPNFLGLVDAVADELPVGGRRGVRVVYHDGCEGGEWAWRVEFREDGIGLSHPVGAGFVWDVVGGSEGVGVVRVGFSRLDEVDEEEEDEGEDGEGREEHFGRPVTSPV